MRHAPDVGIHASELHATGERRLLRAILLDSLRTALSGTVQSARQRQELAWITCRDRTDAFAFENVCAVLGIDPEYVRGRVIAALRKPKGTTHDVRAPVAVRSSVMG